MYGAWLETERTTGKTITGIGRGYICDPGGEPEEITVFIADGAVIGEYMEKGRMA